MIAIERIKARTAARKAAGECQTYPEHAGAEPAARPTRRKAAGPCRHRGRELTGPERDARGLDHRRVWSLCTHAELPLGEAVCGCKGCGPNCTGYESAEEAGGD